MLPPIVIAGLAIAAVGFIAGKDKPESEKVDVPAKTVPNTDSGANVETEGSDESQTETQIEAIANESESDTDNPGAVD